MFGPINGAIDLITSERSQRRHGATGNGNTSTRYIIL